VTPRREPSQRLELREPRLRAHRIARRAAGVLLTAALAAITAFMPVVACVRHADVRDEPDADLLGKDPQLDAGDIPELDSGIGGDAFPQCGDRPIGDCQGTNDFPCAFDTWVTSTAASCQEATGCATNGWLEVKMGADGCVNSIGMDQPNAEIVACLTGELGSVRCPCIAGEATYFFGYGNAGACAE
jgi:hypothetical protein